MGGGQGRGAERVARRAGKGSCHSSTFGFDRRPCPCSFNGLSMGTTFVFDCRPCPCSFHWARWNGTTSGPPHLPLPPRVPPLNPAPLIVFLTSSSCSSPQPCPSLLLSPSRFLSPRVSSLASSEAVTGKAVGPDGMRVLAPALKTRPTLQSLKYARG